MRVDSQTTLLKPFQPTLFDGLDEEQIVDPPNIMRTTTTPATSIQAGNTRNNSVISIPFDSDTTYKETLSSALKEHSKTKESLDKFIDALYTFKKEVEDLNGDKTKSKDRETYKKINESITLTYLYLSKAFEKRSKFTSNPEDEKASAFYHEIYDLFNKVFLKNPRSSISKKLLTIGDKAGLRYQIKYYLDKRYNLLYIAEVLAKHSAKKLHPGLDEGTIKLRFNRETVSQ